MITEMGERYLERKRYKEKGDEQVKTVQAIQSCIF